MSALRVAAAQYPIDQLADWASYETKLSTWVSEAAGRGAKLLVFPEYGLMELAALDPARMGSLSGSLEAVSNLLPRVDSLHAELSRRHGVHILAATAPCLSGEIYVNRARLFTPAGTVGVQDKLVMTRFEAEDWGVSAGSSVRLFVTELGKFGITICYDSEFPLISRALMEAGADVILVPSCTDALHGYWRVRHSCEARALEGQCLVVQAPTVGTAPWSPAVDVNRGAAAIYGPPDGAFPDDGVIAQGKLDQPGWVYADLDLAEAARLRRDGSVLNWRDWDCQPGAGTLPNVEIVDLSV